MYREHINDMKEQPPAEYGLVANMQKGKKVAGAIPEELNEKPSEAQIRLVV